MIGILYPTITTTTVESTSISTNSEPNVIIKFGYNIFLMQVFILTAKPNKPITFKNDNDSDYSKCIDFM